MEQVFTDKVVIVTGASRANGIGAETARIFAKEGARAVVITSRSQSKKNALLLVEELKQLGTEAMWIPGDIAHPDTPKKTIQAVIKAYGRLDVVVNNAGVKIDKPVNAISSDEWDAVMNTNARAAYGMLREAVNVFSKKEGGAIVNVSSIVGVYGNTGQANYAAAKAAIVGLTRSAAIDLGRRNIRVNAVLPGFVETDMTNTITEELKEILIDSTPLGRLGTPTDVANLIVFLASPKAAFITGQAFAVDGGLDGGIVAISGIVRAGYIKKKFSS